MDQLIINPTPYGLCTAQYSTASRVCTCWARLLFWSHRSISPVIHPYPFIHTAGWLNRLPIPAEVQDINAPPALLSVRSTPPLPPPLVLVQLIAARCRQLATARRDEANSHPRNPTWVIIHRGMACFHRIRTAQSHTCFILYIHRLTQDRHPPLPGELGSGGVRWKDVCICCRSRLSQPPVFHESE